MSQSPHFIPPSFPPLVYIHLFSRSFASIFALQIGSFCLRYSYTRITSKQEKYSHRFYEEISINTVLSTAPSYQVGTLKNDSPPLTKCIQGTFLESVNIILSAKRVFAILIQILRTERSSWVIQVSLGIV